MCLQCLAKARLVKKDILPGYFLMVSTQNAPGWPKSHYGLVRCNDPDFVWEGRPSPDPYHGLSDHGIESSPKNIHEAFHKWSKMVEKTEEAFHGSAMDCYRFVDACKKAGYRPERDGYNVVMWFVDYAGRKLKMKKCRRPR